MGRRVGGWLARDPAGVAVNDGALKSVVLNANGEGGAASWEAAGIVVSSPRSISSATFVNGMIDSYGNGYFQAGFKLQFSTDGSTWVDSGWAVSPTYPDSRTAAGRSYTFQGAGQSGIVGARVTGQTGAESWSGAIEELDVFSQ